MPRLRGMAKPPLFTLTAPNKRCRVRYHRGSQARHSFPPQDAMPDRGSEKQEPLMAASRLLDRHVMRSNSHQLQAGPQESRNKPSNLLSLLALGIPSHPAPLRDTPLGSCSGGSLMEGIFPLSP